MIEPCTKMLKQCYFQLNCLSALKWSIFAVSEGNLDFLDFLQKSFITSTTGPNSLKKNSCEKYAHFKQSNWPSENFHKVTNI